MAGTEVVEGGHDLVGLAEVIEHLDTAAPTVLAFLRRFLRAGGTLLLQTPNAVALSRRLKMLMGRNPTEPIRPNRLDPGHFHEYTVAELTAAAAAADLTVEHVDLANHFANAAASAGATTTSSPPGAPVPSATGSPCTSPPAPRPAPEPYRGCLDHRRTQGRPPTKPTRAMRRDRAPPPP